MKPLRFWKTRNYLGPLIPILLLGNAILYHSYGPDLIASAGLMLDVIGACILALPDIPEASDYTASGLIAFTRRQIDENEFGFSSRMDPDFFDDGVGGSSQKKGFHEFKQALEKQHEKRKQDTDINWESIHIIDPQNVRKSGGQRRRILKGISEEGQGFQFEFRYADNLLRLEQEEQEGRIRRLGIALLLIGFLHQIASNLLNVPVAL